MSSVSKAEELEDRLVEARNEIERLQLTLQVIGTVDLDTGLLNRNGVLESLDRGRRWMNRRGDIYGLILVRFPRMPVLDPRAEADLDTIKHLAATIAAGVRDVDDVGRTDDLSYAAVLADLKPGAIDIVTARVVKQLSGASETLGAAGGTYRLMGLEVLNSSHTSGVVLDAAERMVERVSDGGFSVSQL